MESQDMCRCYKENEECLGATRPAMDPVQKGQLKQLLESRMRNGD